MFRDDPDPMVMTARVGFRDVSDTHARGLRDVRRFGKREPKTRLVSERSMKARGEHGNYERMHVLKTKTATRCRCNADDAMMKCNRQINPHNDNEEH